MKWQKDTELIKHQNDGQGFTWQQKAVIDVNDEVSMDEKTNGYKSRRLFFNCLKEIGCHKIFLS